MSEDVAEETRRLYDADLFACNRAQMRHAVLMSVMESEWRRQDARRQGIIALVFVASLAHMCVALTLAEHSAWASLAMMGALLASIPFACELYAPRDR